ncbi:MAG: trigger factor [Patescibacteria group bacterium]|nr:trigger factor [Patescibacteria group bacterium]
MKLNYSRKQKSETEIEFEVTIPSETFEKEYKKLIDQISKDVSMKGFRKGKVPASYVESSHSEKAMEQALNKLLPKFATEVLIKEKVNAVIPVKYTVMKYGAGSEVLFKVSIVVIPQFKIPDLKKVKVEKEKMAVTKNEIDDLLKHLWQEHRNKCENQDDAWVKKVAPNLGFSSKSMADLRKELEKSIKVHKQRLIDQKYESEVLAKIIELSKVSIPKEIIDYEAESRAISFDNQLKKLKITQEDFCKMRKVKMEDMKKQWRKDSKMALENDALLSEYAKQQKIDVTDEELAVEIKQIKDRSKDKDKDGKIFDNPEWSRYIKRVVLKRKSFRALLKEHETLKSSS